MSARLALTLAGYAAFLAVVGMVSAVRGRRVGGLVAGLVALEGLLVLNAVIDLVAQLRGRHVAEPATHGGYLIASVVLMPVLVGRTWGGPAEEGHRPGRWDDCALGLVAVVLAVVCVRLQQTAGPVPA